MNPLMKLHNGETLEIETESGRTIHLFLHECENCISLDVWTDRGNAIEEVSVPTGDTTRAPVGFFGWRSGQRYMLNLTPVEGSLKWPAISTATLLWDPS